MKISFKRIEAGLQRLVEGTISRLIPQSMQKENILTRLVEAMHTGVQSGPTGEYIAPNLYLIEMNALDIDSMPDPQALLENLASFLAEAGQEAGYVFPAAPIVRIEPQYELVPGNFVVKALNSLAEISPTEGISSIVPASLNLVPENAYLIIDGTEVFHLDSVFINIGRRPDNQLIISDPSVSRLHAQLRVKDGKFFVFDLASASGTKVNGKTIHQHELQSGDVLLLGKIPLVFVQEEI